MKFELKWADRFEVLRIVVTYALLGGLWIYLSDSFVGLLVQNPAIITRIAVFKGMFFIFFTSALLYFLIGRYMIRISESHQQLKESEERFRTFVENANDIVFSLSPTGVFTYVSPTWKEAFGYELYEVIGQPFEPFVHPEDVPQCHAFLKKVIESGEKQSGVEYRVRCKNGTWVWYDANGSLIVDAKSNSVSLLGIGRDITERKQALELLRNISLTDELTGLNNRRGFMHLAKQQVKIADRNGKGLVLVFVDIDRLKWINDTYGHGMGDQALIDTAGILRNSFRAADIIARIGGDEFIVFSVDPEVSAGNTAPDRLRENLHAHNLESNRTYQLSLSYGITMYDPDSPCSIEQLLERGDLEMYKQKQTRG